MKIKKIGAILAGAVMIGSAVAASGAWDPSEHEDFFVDYTTGQPNCIVVAGENAADKDITGAAWIAAQIGSMCQKVETVCPVESAEWDSGAKYDCPVVLLTNTSPFSGPCYSYDMANWDLDSLFWNDCDGDGELYCDEPIEYIGLGLTETEEGVYPCIPAFCTAWVEDVPGGLVYGSLSNVSDRCTIEIETPGCPSCPKKIQGIYYFPTCYNDLHLLGETYTVLDSFIACPHDGYKDEAILFGEPNNVEGDIFLLGESPHVYADGWEVTLEDINLMESSVLVTIDNPKYGVHVQKILNVNTDADWDYGEFYTYNVDLLGAGDWYYCYHFLPDGLIDDYECDIGCCEGFWRNNGDEISLEYEGTTIFSIIPRHVFMGYSTKQAVMDVYTLEDAWTLDDECCLSPCGDEGNWWNLRVKNWCSIDCCFDSCKKECWKDWFLMGGAWCGCDYCECEEIPYDVGVFLTLQETLCVTGDLPCEYGMGSIRVPLCTFDPKTVEEYWVAEDPGEPYFTVLIDDRGDPDHTNPTIEKGIKIWQDIHLPCYDVTTPVVINPMTICKLDSEITAWDKQSKNLILVGGPGFVDVTELPANTITQEVYQARYSVDWFTSEGEYQYLANVFADGVDVLIVAGKDRDATRAAVLKLIEDMES